MSQDVHTPRVIASHFVASDACGFILPSSARRRPETLPMMDEVDGRPGPVALQFGHLDAPSDVPVVSLSLPSANLLTCHPREAGANLLLLSINSHIGNPSPFTGEHHENLPGK